MDQLGHLLSQIHIECHSNVNICPVFYLKASLCYTKPFRKKLDGSCVYSLFLGNNRQQMPVCAKTIFSCVWKVLSIAKAHKSASTVCGAVVSAALVAGISLKSILQAGDLARVSTPDRHYFSAYITTTDQHQDSILSAVLGVTEWSPCG